MRPGLVVVGGLIAVLGVATLLAFNLLPTTSERREGYSTVPQPFGPHESGSALLPGTDADHGTLSVTWRSSSPVDVTLYPAEGCTEPGPSCASGAAAASWSSVMTGAWSTAGSLHFPYLVTWTAAGTENGTFTASGVESTEVVVAPNVIDVLLVDGAAAALTVIGGVAVFLGVFLRSGVYRGPAPVVSRSADDLEFVVPPDGPPRR